MMLRLWQIITFLTALFLSGCKISSSVYYEDDPSYYGVYGGLMHTFYLVDRYDRGIGHIDYVCDYEPVRITDKEGGFDFRKGQTCSFHLTLERADSRYDALYITTRYGEGVRGIYFVCDSGYEGYTDKEGRFAYDTRYRGEDVCTFSF